MLIIDTGVYYTYHVIEGIVMNVVLQWQYVEMFHLLFLSQLGLKMDKRFYALKGGCNLRFFFKSPRYSEDMDLDITRIPVHRVETIVSGILKSKSFEQTLQVRGIRIARINNDKQTATTQRWKLALRIPRTERSVPTKIEFSRCGMEDDVGFEVVDPLLTTHYEMPPIATNHYLVRSAFKQKIQALADRRETQARDIFDLDILLSAGAAAEDIPEQTRAKLHTARENILLLDYDVFRSQVLAFLPMEYYSVYDEKMWDAMRLRICDALEKVTS